MIAKVLTAIRELQIPYWQKARNLARELKKLDCTDVRVVDCDVCIEILFPKFTVLLEKCAGDFTSLEKAIPQEAKVRLHAQTPEGYLTYCFYCDSTMCGNSFDYPKNPDWDRIHFELTKEFLIKHPELKVEKFMLSGSTRHTIHIDILGEQEFGIQEKIEKEIRIVIWSASKWLAEKLGEKLKWNTL